MNPHSYVAPRWRFNDLIESLKPYRSIAESLEAAGYPRLPLPSIAGWRRRNSIPPAWVPALIQLGLEARVIGSIDDLRIKPLEKRHAKHSRTAAGA